MAALTEIMNQKRQSFIALIFYSSLSTKVKSFHLTNHYSTHSAAPWTPMPEAEAPPAHTLPPPPPQKKLRYGQGYREKLN